MSTLESLQHAIAYHRAGRLDEAEQYYRQTLATDPHSAHALHSLGVIAHQRCQYAAAVDLITRAIAVDRGQPSFHANLAAANLALGRNAAAVDSLREVVRLQPTLAAAHNELGVLLAKSARWNEAAECFLQVLRIHGGELGKTLSGNGHSQNGENGSSGEWIASFSAPHCTEAVVVQAHVNLGNTLKALGRLEEAIEHYRLALAIDPNYAAGHFNLAIALRERGEPEAAIESYRRALGIRPDLIEARFNIGQLLRARGLTDKAREAFELVVEARPSVAEAHYQLGAVLRELGKLQLARAALERSIGLKPTLVEARHELAGVLYDQRDFAAAAAGYREVLWLKPDRAEAYHNLALALRELQHFSEAEDCCRRALDLNHDFAEAHQTWGLILKDQNRLAEALAHEQEAVRLCPDSPRMQTALGAVLESQGAFHRALICFGEAARLRPDSAAALSNLGAVLSVVGPLDEAACCFQQALRLNPNFAEAENGLGLVKKMSGHLDEAAASFRRALQLNPDYAEAQSNLGELMREQGDFTAALAHFDQAIARRGNLAQARFNRAITLLLLGDFAAGWSEYEWRMRGPALLPNQWDGSPLDGRTLLVHLEQGLGDAMQFIRYAPLARRRGGNVIVRCRPSLIPLLSTCQGIDRFSSESDPLPPFDVQVNLLSLPGVFHTDLASIPSRTPYLFAREELVERYREEFRAQRGLRVGIGWQGNRQFQDDGSRSMPLAEFAPLAAVDGVRLFSLQKGVGSEQLADAKFDVQDLGCRLDEAGEAFCETAAVIKNLDLVITSDTALAHLAGALGAPVWVAVSFSPDWRWLLDRGDSPWYPTMRLFRQSRIGDWSEVFGRMASELALVAARHQGPTDRAS